MWVLLDNYDSFTYILHHYLIQTGVCCEVFRNDEITVEALRFMNPERIIISPGPETPKEAGICLDVIHQFHQSTPILGVCLGHQALGTYFGARLVKAPEPRHGKTSEIIHQEEGIFRDIPNPMRVMRYHSLVLENLDRSELVVTATSLDDGQVMAMKHPRFPCTGVQFHPESIGTIHGLQLLQNWKDLFDGWR
jgi:anthranilate synthase/aminodeoxychorismate synthase-like glutamine amidotransferase